MSDLRAAFRSLLATPWTTGVVIATLAVGLGAATAIFSVAERVLLRPLGYGDESELVVLWGRRGEGADPAADDLFRLSPADYRDLRDDVASFGGQAALYRSIGSTLSGLEPAVRVGSYAVTPRLFRVLDARPALGRLFGEDDERPGGEPVAVLTHASWQRRFGADPGIVGRALEVDGAPRTVVGVAPPGFVFPPGAEEVELYIPMALSDAILLDRDHRMFDAVARLAPGVSLAAANAELDALALRLAREFPRSNEGWSLEARPLREEVLEGVGPTLWILTVAVLLVLAIACVNIANVLLARSTASDGEFAVRSALGAGRRALLRRSLAESALLGVAGGALAVVLATWGGAALHGVLPADLPRRADAPGGLGPPGLLFAAGLTLASTLLVGLLPALRAAAARPAALIQSASSGGDRRGRLLREALVAFQVALAVVLLVGAVLTVRSFQRLQRVDPGFRPGGVVAMAVQLPGSRYGRAEWPGFFERLVERAEALPGVASAGAVSDLPMSDVGLGFELEFTAPGLETRSPSLRPNGDVRLVTPGYFETMGAEILAGRDFDPTDAERRPRVVIVNETLVERIFGAGASEAARDGGIVGRTLDVELLGDVEIVGVVAPIRHAGLQARHEAEIYLPYGGSIVTAEMQIVARAATPAGRAEWDLATMAPELRGALDALDDEIVPGRIVAVEALVSESVSGPRFRGALLSLLALCAALLAAVGTAGLVAWSVARRRREIGLRMAMGAGRRDAVRLVVSRAAAVVSLGVVLGIAASLAAAAVLRSLLFETEAIDPLVYALVAGAALLLAVVASGVPALRAARVDPASALRSP